MKVLCVLAIFAATIHHASAFLFVEGVFDSNERWTNFSKQDELNVKNLIQHLAKSPTGKELLRQAKNKAAKRGETLTDVVKPGSGSLTDTTLIRRFSRLNPAEVVYETRSVVYVNRNLNQYDAILDLAHELTHFVYRGGFNPYQPGFALGEFIKNTIEGPGGEARAFVRECRVLNELFPKQKASRYNCDEVADPKTGKISFQMAVERFYQVGHFEGPFKRLLMKEGVLDKFPELNSQEVSFVSSAYGVPYPVAAYKEYKAVMSKVCDNDKKRLAYIARSEALSSGRSPASSEGAVEFAAAWKKKCANFN